MPNYRRLYIPGGCYFFTVVTAKRRPILVEPAVRQQLRNALQRVRSKHPFAIEGLVLLPDHLHTVWRLPQDDDDFSLRWRLVKTYVTRYVRCDGPVWQARYWEHAIRDEADLRHHLDYLHWNPVKHGLVERVRDWPWSSFHRFVDGGLYPVDWCASPVVADYAFG